MSTDQNGLLYDALLGSIDAAGDDGPLGWRTLLWFLRNVMAVEPLDAYEHAFSDPALGIDGLLVQEADDIDEDPTLFVFEVKSTPGPVDVGPAAVAAARGASDIVLDLGRHVSSHAPTELASLASRMRLVERLSAGDLTPQAVLVTTGRLSPEALVAAAQTGVRTFDLEFLAQVALALQVEGLRQAELPVLAGEGSRFLSQTGIGRIAVCAVNAPEIANWPGIDDRSLFGLNVRRQLRQNQVRTGLTKAVENPADHANFLAYHNGLTVVCRRFDPRPDQLIVHDLSVVNGAQSVIALRESAAALTNDLQILVKFVEVGENRQLPAEVAQRSNTQTAVNPRNLRALDGRQRFLERDFSENYPAYRYVTRPDASLHEPGIPVPNDVAAQLLCAVYAQRPWLAVKRTELFRAPNYSIVFPPQIRAAHVLMSKRIREAVESQKGAFPQEYRRSWALTALVATYLVAQLLREDEEGRAWLDDPAAALTRESLVAARLEHLAGRVGRELTKYHEWRSKTDGFDDFKVDFKNRTTLRTLASDLVRSYVSA